MTASEIRLFVSSTSGNEFAMLREIAAQLAEHNETQREMLKLQVEAREEQKQVAAQMLAGMKAQQAETHRTRRV